MVSSTKPSIVSGDWSKIEEAANRYPKPNDVIFNYGTAGFRTLASLMSSIAFRMGLLAALRSKALNGSPIGIMITASHNPECDNGVKLVEPDGSMLMPKWEVLAAKLANVASADDVCKMLKFIIKDEAIDVASPCCVVVGKDTRKSGVELAKACFEALSVAHCHAIDIGVVTTPQLHFMVNELHAAKPETLPASLSEQSYFDTHAHAFNQIMKCLPFRSEKPLIIDCANGVGAMKLKMLAQVVGPANLNVQLINDGNGELNKDCGADFVKINQKAPLNISMESNVRYASLDGDADRLVFFYLSQDGKFALLDGDKISTLFAALFKNLCQKLSLECSIGVVQTAYANGSSTRYIKEHLSLPVDFVCTGIKNLHHKAHDYDIGIYFEANGHGTVLMSKKVVNAASEMMMARKAAPLESQKVIKIFYGLTRLINQTVGDALSDLLTVEVALSYFQYDLPDWNKCYADLPSRQMKVKVANRYILETANADMTLVKPNGVQDKLNELAASYECGRVFARPSGTEDVVRVYAEAKTQAAADDFAIKACKIVYDTCGGVGEIPK